MYSIIKKESKCRMIFEEDDKEVKLANSPLSFEGCPNRCVEGYYIDPYRHKKIKCLYCEKKRKQLIRNEVALDSDKTINERLHIPETFMGYGEFNIDTIIPEFERKNLIEASVVELTEVLEGIIEQISVGLVPSYSMLFNFGKQSHSDNFINPYLVRAYMSGLTVAPYITASILYALRRLMLDDTNKSILRFIKSAGYEGVEFADYIDKDVCVIEVDNGCSYDEISAVQGLMQLRGRQGKSTLVVINVLPSQVKCLNSMEEKRLDYGYYYSVKYNYDKSGVSQTSRGVGGSLSSDAFSSLKSSKNTL